MKFTDILQDIGKPTQFYADLKHVTGSHNATIFLGQLTYWTGKGHLPDGWIYKTQEEWELEIELSVDEQESARKTLRNRGLIDERHVGMPRRLEYKVNEQKVNDSWDAWMPALKIKGQILDAIKERRRLKNNYNADTEITKEISALKEQYQEFKKQFKNHSKADVASLSGKSRYRQRSNPDNEVGHSPIVSTIYTEINSENTQERMCKNSNPNIANQEASTQTTKELTQLEEVIEPNEVAPVSRTLQETNGVQDVKNTSSESNPSISGTPISAAPPAILQQEKSNEIIGGELVLTHLEDDNPHGDLPEKLAQIMTNYDCGVINQIDDATVKQVAKIRLGDFPKKYRKSGMILSSKPNDINPEFLRHFFTNHKFKDLDYARNTILAMERNPSKWDSLRQAVGIWEAVRDSGNPNIVKDAFKAKDRQESQSRFSSNPVFNALSNKTIKF